MGIEDIYPHMKEGFIESCYPHLKLKPRDVYPHIKLIENGFGIKYYFVKK
jgi:hypothetical protein